MLDTTRRWQQRRSTASSCRCYECESVSELAAELTYINGRFVRDVAIEYDDATGRITRVRTGATDVHARMQGRALMPGFSNVHSHAFQRAIRGRTQWRP